jgi:uncharacterized protein
MRVVSEFPRPVRVVEHTWVPMPDGCRLAARIWLPEDAGHDPVPAVVEYIPYRKNDATALRDAPIHAYFAGHGYASVRVDMRGSGDSDGILEDEYLPLEQQDGVEVLRWLAAQPWCTGRVGIIGKSWGGFNGLQIAALAPPELGAVISVASTDDRYADDVHYMGGCLLSWDMLPWAATMLAYNARPPDPAVVGDSWRQRWIDRMDHTPPFIERWLAHQRRDGLWKQGSVCEDYPAIGCAVYMVGGWADAYRNAVLRFLENYPGPCKGLIGPWGHVYPQDGAPGPAIGFLQEAVRWWDYWLKGADNGIMNEPRLRVYMQEAMRPAPSLALRPGRWVAEPGWPTPAVSARRFALVAAEARRSAPGPLTGETEAVAGGPGTLADEPGPEAELRVRGSESVAADPGPWCGWGGPIDYPADQRADDGLSLTFDTAPLTEPHEILGFPSVRLVVASDRPRALVAVRLCDIWPDGASTLVARGLLNLTHHASSEEPSPLEPGRRYSVEVRLGSIAYSVPAGHRLRLAVSPAYWPWAWPSPEAVTLTVVAGPGSFLDLPLRTSSGAEEPPPPHFSEPEAAPLPPHEALGSRGEERSMERDARTGLVRIVAKASHFPSTHLLDSGICYDEDGTDVYQIVLGEPLSALTVSERSITIARGGWQTRVETQSTLSASAEAFLVTNTLEAYERDARVFARSWYRSVPRDGV